MWEEPPLDNPATTHGICDRHRRQLLEQLPSASFPGIDALLVVARNEVSLYQHLSEAFRGLRGIAVIMDRRAGDRRRSGQTTVPERRHCVRRQDRGEKFALGYTIIRFNRRA